MKLSIAVFSFFYILYTPIHLFSQAVINKKEVINEMVIYPDLKDVSIFYYSPGNLQVAKDNFGKPEINFLQMRYTGTQASGDQGKINYRSILQFTIQMKNPDGNQLRDVRTILETRNKKTVQLLPLPVRKMEAVLVYASVGDDGSLKDKPQKVSGGSFENADGADENKEIGEYWNERTFTVSLDKYSSQIFWSTIEKGQMFMSLVFSYYVVAVNPTSPEFNITVEGPMKEAVNNEMQHFADSSDSTSKAILLGADAISVTIDSKKYPELIRKIDINEAFIPPDFAMLDVRCYDFNNSLRPDLYAKRIEVEAVGMNGEPVRDRRTFYASEPDIYFAGIRFKYAVRMNKPFRYRIVEIKNDTAPLYSQWTEVKSWNKIIDITTKK